MSFLVYEYYYYLNINDPAAAFNAISEMEKQIEYYPESQLKDLKMEFLFAYSYLQPDAEVAQTLYAEVKDKLIKGRSVADYRIQAAYALFIQKKPDLAVQFIEKAKKVADIYLVKSFIPLEKELLSSLEEMLEEEKSIISLT